MKTSSTFIFVMLFSSLFSRTLRAQPVERVDLPKEWKFMTGDDADYSKPEYDDSGWKSIRVDKYWENQGYEHYDGVAWYRTRIRIPSTLRDIISMGEVLSICLGQIDDDDSAYVNGTRIGHTELYRVTRKYLIPFDIIHWDKENTIAVRVDDIGGYGGMNAGPYYIRPASSSDVVHMHSNQEAGEISTTGNDSISWDIRFGLLRPVTLSGELETKVVNLNARSVPFHETRRLTIGKGADTSASFAMNLSESGSFKAYYWFVNDSLKDTVGYSTLLGHAALPRQEMKAMAPVVSPRVPDKCISIPLENIHLRGYLEDRMLANLNRRLLHIDETGLLDGYLNRPGNHEYVNEYVGKYLSAASREWRYTRNAALKTQMDRVVDILLGCQNEDGYLGTYLPEDHWKSWDVWGHKYNLIGLLSYYAATGFEPALEASRKIGDLLCRTFGRGDGKQDIIEAGPYVGLASCSVLEAMVDLYRHTGDAKYLDFCNHIVDAYEEPDGPRVVSTLLSDGRVHGIASGKAYELLSNLLGTVKLYRMTGNKKLLKAAEAAWTAVARYRLYITGSTSSHECFQARYVLPADTDANICEGCVTTEWLHFNEELFRISGDAKYMNAMEQTVYNHLLAAENPLTGGVSYYTPLQGRRRFRLDIEGNCCLASVPRGISAIPEFVYTRNADNGLAINIYSAGRVDCKIQTKDGREIPVKCSLETDFPETGRVRIVLDPGSIARFKLALRVPDWCKGFKALVPGATYYGTPGKYLVIERKWKKKTIINIECDLSIRVIAGGRSYRNYIALKRGPQILALDASLNPGIGRMDDVRINARRVSVTVPRSKLPGDWVGDQMYEVRAKTKKNRPIKLNIVPFADADQQGGDVRVWLKKE